MCYLYESHDVLAGFRSIVFIRILTCNSLVNMRAFTHTHTHAHTHIRAHTHTWTGIHTHTTVFDDERQKTAAIHAAAIVPLAASVPPCTKRQLYRYRHAAATAATHKRSRSCKHSVSHQETLLDSSALHGRRREAAPT